MDKLKLCIPTLNRYELCLKLIWTAEHGTIKPEEYVILDNGGGFREVLNKSDYVINTNIRIHTPKRNLGVGGSWNWFLENCSGNLLIANDDLLFSPNVVEKFLLFKKSEDYPHIIYFMVDGAFELFMTDTSILTKIGKFDENFYPAYFEDNDFRYRMIVSGFRPKEGFAKVHADEDVYHERSATLKLMRKEEHNKNFDKNKEYYIRKWGGLPDQEIYTIPFNGK